MNRPIPQPESIIKYQTVSERAVKDFDVKCNELSESGWTRCDTMIVSLGAPYEMVYSQQWYKHEYIKK